MAAFWEWDEWGVWTAAGIMYTAFPTIFAAAVLTLLERRMRNSLGIEEGFPHLSTSRCASRWKSDRKDSQMLELPPAFLLKRRRDNGRAWTRLRPPSQHPYREPAQRCAQVHPVKLRIPHVCLVADCAYRWNKLLERKDKNTESMQPFSIPDVPHSGETFGMMKMSAETASHQSLASTKEEPMEEGLGLFYLSPQDLLDASRILSQLGVDPLLLHQLLWASIQPMTAAAQAEFSTPRPCTATRDSVGSQPVFVPHRPPPKPLL